jgi:hypothetical protein
MTIKKDLKVLRYIHRRRSVPMDKLEKRFPDRTRLLIDNGLITYIRHTSKDNDGFPIETYPENTPCWLSDAGIAIVEANQWLDARFILLQVVVPIVIGVLSGVITNVILALR